MTTFITKTIDGVPAVEDHTWQDVLDASAENYRSRITVEDYSKIEISEQQRKWLHCKAGPIRELMRAGWSFREAKEHIKVEYGRQWFVVELTGDNFRDVDGVFRWECRKATCRKIYHPMNIKRGFGGSHDCVNCGRTLEPIALKSIMDISVKKTNLWFDEIFAHMPNIQQPDPEWKKRPKKSRG